METPKSILDTLATNAFVTDKLDSFDETEDSPKQEITQIIPEFKTLKTECSYNGDSYEPLGTLVGTDLTIFRNKNQNKVVLVRKWEIIAEFESTVDGDLLVNL